MGLKQNIVVVNRFTTKTAQGGTRGKTPGKFVLMYMAREGACEPLAPVEHPRKDLFVTRYMAREDAAEKAQTVYEADKRVTEVTGLGGRGFGYGSPSLGHDAIIAASKDIQKHFEKGHTVYETVISFDSEYLRENGIIPADFVAEERGDFSGMVDHMKLRLAIMNGLDHMSQKYDDLRYVGTVQTDTMHVHCHLAMFDAGDGNITKHGQQRGVIPQDHFMLLRRGIDNWIDEKQHVRHMSSAVGYERRNAVSYVKRWTYDEMTKSSTPQFLLATLPEDTSMWRAKSRAKEMERPNRIARHMVEEVLDRPGSPMTEAMLSIKEYANYRAENEELSLEEWQTLVSNGREDIVNGCINSVYQMLKSVPEYELHVMTPVLSIMAMDEEELSQIYAVNSPQPDNDLVGFGYRIRSYANRQQEHTSRAKKHKNAARSWEAAQDAGVADPGSVALYRLFREEQEYEEMLAAKYHHLLPFRGREDDWYDDWEEIDAYGQRMMQLEMMIADRSLGKYKDPDEAERMGRRVYQQAGGRYLTGGTAGRSVLRNRLALMRETYSDKLDAFVEKTHDRGLKIEVDDVATLSVKAQEGQTKIDISITNEDIYPFDYTRAMDLHKVGGDFSKDAPVDQSLIANFTKRARQRRRLLEDASEYLIASEQAAMINMLPVDDINEMNEMADRFDGGMKVVPSKIAELAKKRARTRAKRRSTTVELDQTLTKEAQRIIDREAAQRLRKLPQQVRKPQPESRDRSVLESRRRGDVGPGR